MKGLRLMKTMLELNIDVDSFCQRINNISKSYWMLKSFEKSCDDIMRTSAVDTASLDEEFSWLNEDLKTQWLSSNEKTFEAHWEIWDDSDEVWGVCICAELVWRSSSVNGNKFSLYAIFHV